MLGFILNLAAQMCMHSTLYLYLMPFKEGPQSFDALDISGWVTEVQHMYQNKNLRYFCDICVCQKLWSQIHRLFSSKLVKIITEFSVELSRHQAVRCAIFPQTSCFNILKTRLPSPHEKSLQ